MLDRSLSRILRMSSSGPRGLGTTLIWGTVAIGESGKMFVPFGNPTHNRRKNSGLSRYSEFDYYAAVTTSRALSLHRYGRI
jgi:hypothetical protein